MPGGRRLAANNWDLIQTIWNDPSRPGMFNDPDRVNDMSLDFIYTAHRIWKEGKREEEAELMNSGESFAYWLAYPVRKNMNRDVSRTFCYFISHPQFLQPMCLPCGPEW